MNFEKGLYFYIGRARKGLKARIRRHLIKNKKLFWHIDYLLYSNYAKIKEIWTGINKQECQIARHFYRNGYDYINRFGSSDCHCRSHLFFTDKGMARAKNLLGKEEFRNADKDSFR